MLRNGHRQLRQQRTHGTLLPHHLGQRPRPQRFQRRARHPHPFQLLQLFEFAPRYLSLRAATLLQQLYPQLAHVGVLAFSHPVGDAAFQLVLHRLASHQVGDAFLEVFQDRWNLGFLGDGSQRSIVVDQPLQRQHPAPDLPAVHQHLRADLVRAPGQPFCAEQAVQHAE